MKNLNRASLILMIVLLLGLSGIGYGSEQPGSKIVYLLNGQQIECDKAWVDSNWLQSKEYKVWYQIGASKVSLSSVYVDIARTFGEETESKHRASMQDLDNQKRREGELRTAMHIGHTGGGGLISSQEKYVFGDIEVSRLSVYKAYPYKRSVKVPEERSSVGGSRLNPRVYRSTSYSYEYVDDMDRPEITITCMVNNLSKKGRYVTVILGGYTADNQKIDYVTRLGSDIVEAGGSKYYKTKLNYPDDLQKRIYRWEVCGVEAR